MHYKIKNKITILLHYDFIVKIYIQVNNIHTSQINISGHNYKYFQLIDTTLNFMVKNSNL